MKKAFVLDTNVLLHDPAAILRFGNNDVIIPITVIEEVDRFKKDMSEVGRNARAIARSLDNLRLKGSLSKGVELNNGGTLRVDLWYKRYEETLPEDLLGPKADNRILSVALILRDKHDGEVIFVTKDTNLRIRADALGVKAQDYEADKVQIEELYSGVVEATCRADHIDRLFDDGKLDLDGEDLGLERELFATEYVVLKATEDSSRSALGRFDKESNSILPVKRIKEGVWGIFPKNKEQAFAFDALLDDRLQLVSLVGKAGTGKTLLAIAAGLQKVADENQYARLLVSRPIFPLGRDIGFLPGDIEEKLNPWMKPIFDNVELLLEINPTGKRRERGYEELLHMGILEIEPLTYIRGRSIPNQFLVVDEAQNLTPHEIKTIITRAGEHTKVVLTGDPYQIDNPYVDSSSNGLTYTVAKFKNEPVAGHVTLLKGERSTLAELAANLL